MGISPQSARNIIGKTTQSEVQQFNQPPTHHFSTHQKMLSNWRMNEKNYTETLLSSIDSVDGDTCAQFFVTIFDDVSLYSM